VGEPDPDRTLPVLYDILERYADSEEPSKQRIAKAVRQFIAELEDRRED
jgi:hypothetical protein